MEYKPTIVFDFDGVIHSYKSGWKGPGNIPDPVVPGIKEAITELRRVGYRVVVVSTRCSSPDGTEAVQNYLQDNDIRVDDVMMEKPPALCYIDDRAICFRGNATNLVKQVQNFKPWIEEAAGNEETVSKLRPCKAISYENGQSYEVIGRFHRWGLDFIEFDVGPGHFTTAIIETDDGKVVTCAAESVQFLDRIQK